MHSPAHPGLRRVQGRRRRLRRRYAVHARLRYRPRRLSRRRRRTRSTAPSRGCCRLPPETRLFMCHDYKAPGRDHYAWETTVGEQRDTQRPREGRRRREDDSSPCARRATPNSPAPLPAAAIDPGQHPGGQAAARGCQWRALSQDPREARFLNRPDRTWHDPDALCRRRHAPLSSSRPSRNMNMRSKRSKIFSSWVTAMTAAL